MTYVLIYMVFVQTWNGAYNYPKIAPLVSMQEFNGKAACESAASAIRTMAGDKPIGLTCVQKG